MVSNQIVTGINLWWIAVMTITPALITGVVSIIISRVQLKMKISEIKGESEYKARENLFKLYQEGLRVHREAGNKFAEMVVNTFSYIEGKDERGKIELMKVPFESIRFFKNQIADSIDEFEGELKKHGLFTEKCGKEISFMRKTLSIDLGKVSDEDIPGVVMDYYRVFGSLDSIENTLLEKKRDELFSKYLT